MNRHLYSSLAQLQSVFSLLKQSLDRRVKFRSFHAFLLLFGIGIGEALRSHPVP